MLPLVIFLAQLVVFALMDEFIYKQKINWRTNLTIASLSALLSTIF